MYNSEDFTGKGKQYHADTPEDLYDRMRITLDLRDEINGKLSEDQKVAAFSFPMRYIPLTDTERGYVGSQWNPKYLRAVQCMLIPTQGKGVGSRSFFEADFGCDSTDFTRFLAMPEKLIAARGKFVEGGRGRKKESDKERAARKAIWKRNQEKIEKWNELYASLGEEKDKFISTIADNEFLPEKFLGITSDLQKKLYLLYLTTPRLIQLLGMVSNESPTHKLLYDFIKNDCPALYEEVKEVVAGSENQQSYIFFNFLKCFGREGLKDLLEIMIERSFSQDKLLYRWDRTCKSHGIDYIDFELIRIYRRFDELGLIDASDNKKAINAISEFTMSELALVLEKHIAEFREAMNERTSDEKGKKTLNRIIDSIHKNIQIKIWDVMED